MPDFISKIRRYRVKLPKVNSVSDKSILILKSGKDIKLTVLAKKDTAKPATLTIQGKNLYSGIYDRGYLKFGNEDIINPNSKSHRTTKWFPVLPNQGRSLILSGTAHNRSTWQFKTAEGTILTEEGDPRKYNIATDVLQDKTFSKVDIPKAAAYARVYYACYEDEDIELDDRMQIEYGKVPTHYEPYQLKELQLPPLKKGDFITYFMGNWTLYTRWRKKRLDLGRIALEAGNIITVSSGSCIINTGFPPKRNKTSFTGKYGVRWNVNDRNPVCERVGEAKGYTFNALQNSTWLTPYENSFDSIYPWSAMRLCSIIVNEDGKRQIFYKGEKEFRLDGSSGNVMVEIPKFYCKREIIGDYEYLWVSATKQEGFQLDPSFLTEDGVKDHIYIGAYLTEKIHHKLRSTSNSYPLIYKSLKEIRNLTMNLKDIKECDLLAVLTVQKLFLVETAVLDSQSVFSGNVHLPYLLKDKTTAYYALMSEPATNRIIVKEANVTRRFCVGDAISILNHWKEYKNIPGNFQRMITGIKAAGQEELEITFNGNPIDITEHETGITCIPRRNGSTDEIPYSTGSVGDLSGHASFKYRGIENLWGNVSILLENAYVKDSEVYIKYPTGNTVKLGYQVPVQTEELFPGKFGDPSNMIVKRMGYDKENPLIMLPSEIGNGAKTSGYYCDAWYNNAKEGVAYILTYGGAWDNKGYAGIFNFRASFTHRGRMPYNGSRIMLR